MTISDIAYLKDDIRKDEYICTGIKEIGTTIFFIMLNNRTKRKKLLAKDKINELILPDIPNFLKKKSEGAGILKDVIQQRIEREEREIR